MISNLSYIASYLISSYLSEAKQSYFTVYHHCQHGTYFKISFLFLLHDFYYESHAEQVFQFMKKLMQYDFVGDVWKQQ